MSTFQEHMAADMAAILAEGSECGTSVNIDGTDIDVIRQPVDVGEVPNLTGLLVERDRFWILSAELGYKPVLGQSMDVDSVDWEVESVGDWPLVLLLVLQRIHS